MALYKYMAPESVLRFLSSWALRLTPPNQLNDPFEMQPGLSVVNDDTLSDATLRQELAKRTAEDVTKMLPSGLLDPSWPDLFVASLLDMLSPAQQRNFNAITPAHIREGLMQNMPAMRAQLQSGVSYFRQQLPSVNRHLERQAHDLIPQHIGVLCMSINGYHPLMWAHYADEHRGALIEFDEKGDCFQRNRSASDEFGQFTKVQYVDNRPRIDASLDQDTFSIMALTKHKSWAYEEEMRLVMPLKRCDQVVNSSIHLLNVAPSAVNAIVLGLRASTQLAETVQDALQDRNDTVHIRVKKAVQVRGQYELRYESFHPGLGDAHNL